MTGGMASSVVESAQVVRRTLEFTNTDALEIKYMEGDSISFEYLSPDFTAGFVYYG